MSLIVGLSFVHAQEIVTSVEITNSTLTDPLQVTEEPYDSLKQDFYQIKVDTVQFTKVDELTLGDRVEFELENFDFDKKKYSKETHNIVMASVKTSDALVYIYSEPLQTILFKGVVKDFDLTGDGKDDLRLRYDGLNTETGYGILNVMRFNQEDYKIYGNTFCDREDANSEYACVEVTDKNLGLYKEITLDQYSEIDNSDNLTDDEKLTKKIEESMKNETSVVGITEPTKEPSKSLSDYINIKVIFFIGLLIMLIVIFMAWKKHVGKGGAEINFED